MGKLIEFPVLFTETAPPPHTTPAARVQHTPARPLVAPEQVAMVKRSTGSGICWACGGLGASPRAHGPSYHTRCTQEPWINCDGCGAARKRNRPGERSFTCTRCTHERNTP